MNAVTRENRETVLKWSAYVHDLNYEFGEKDENGKNEFVVPEEVERVLIRIAKDKRATTLMLNDYTTSRVYRLYYGSHDDKRTLMHELYERANAILAKTLIK